MHARQTLLGAVSALGLAWAASAAAQPTVVGFDQGAGGWSWVGGDLPLEAEGGHPGAHAHFVENIDNIGLKTDSNAAFIGNFSASRGVNVGLDAKVESLFNANGQPVTHDLIVEFRSSALAQAGYQYASVWTKLATLQGGTDWTRYAVTFDPRASALPKGWHGTGAEDPATADPVLPPGVTFAAVLAQVDQLVFSTQVPGRFGVPIGGDVRIDNLSLDRDAGPAPATPPRYEVIDLGTFGGAMANAHDINDAGHVAGTAEAPDSTPQAFLWADGALRNLGSLMPGNVPDYGVARGMSQNDYLVGESMTPAHDFPGASVSHAFFWSAQTGMIDLTPDTSLSSQAWDVNSSGQVVGNYMGAFIWSQAAGLKNIGLGAPGGAAEGINDNGQVCGYGQRDANSQTVGWVYDSRTDTIRELPSLGGYTETRRINDAGDVVGSGLDDQRGAHSILWTHDGQLVDLGVVPTPDYSPGFANALNEARWIVGADDYRGNGVLSMGWLWIEGTKYELRDLIADPAQHEAWTDLSTPLGINARNEIVGIGVRDGAGRAFLMRPLPPDKIFANGFE
jgi:probable HAF family extracellular repeat protein